MRTPEQIIKELGVDDVDLSAELLADATHDETVVAKLVALCDRAAEKPRSLTAHEANLVSWAPYIFAEIACPTFIRPLLGVCKLKDRLARHLLGGYAAFDMPCIFVRLAGDEVTKKFTSLLRTRDAAPELRIAPIMACACAWAHGIVGRDDATALLRAELKRLADPETAEAESDEWLDAVLDAALDLNPSDMRAELDAVAATWGFDEAWTVELEEACAIDMRDTHIALRSAYPRLDKAIDFVERWAELDAEEDADPQAN